MSDLLRPSRRQFLACLPAAALSPRLPAEPAPFERFDVHTHLLTVAQPLFASLANERFHCLTICVSREMGKEPSSLPDMIRSTIAVHRASGGRIAWATAFDARGFDQPDFSAKTTTALRTSFDQGAIGVKIWKNIGMGIRGASGEYLLPDNAALAPVFDYIQQAGKTLIAHLAEPDGAWLPLDAHNPEINYYSHHPEWHMYGKPGIPAKDTILQARDRMLAQHPKLRVVGCHLGSDEEHWSRLAKRLDTYPNFAVDMAARVRYFVRGNHEEAREFLTKYQDRVLYGTDITQPTGDTTKTAEDLRTTHEWDWRFFTTRDELTYRNQPFRGLGLPEKVVRKLFRDNALHWLPGIAG